MRISEFAFQVNAKLIIKSDCGRFFCTLERGPKFDGGLVAWLLKDYSSLTTAKIISGSGESPDAALNDYIRKIKGQNISFPDDINGTSRRYRKRYKVPKSLSVS